MNVENNLFALIDSLNNINARTNIFYESSQKKNLPLGDYVIKYIISHKNELTIYFRSTNQLYIEEFIKKMVEYSTERAFETITNLNQYVEINDTLTNKVKKLYKKLLVKVFNELRSKNLTNLNWLIKVVIEHQLKFRGVLEEIDELKIFSNNTKFIEPIPCSEYSAFLQLEILDIALENIYEPILDIGCGKSANLVKYLRELGIEAYGVDRNIKKTLYTIQADWFMLNLKPHYWGTIISHLSFTNHFKRTHFKKNGNHLMYARKYMDLLNSLKLGGSFFYTPDLPYIEQFLSPDLYLINKKNINYKKLHFLKGDSSLNIQTVQIKKLIQKEF